MAGTIRSRGTKALAAPRQGWLGFLARCTRPVLAQLRAFSFGAILIAWPVGVWAEYTLQPGDTLAVSTFGAFTIAHQSTVNVDGDVTLPVVGRMAVAGLTLAEVQAQVAEAMAAKPLRLVNGEGAEHWLNLQPSEILVEIANYAPVFVTGTVSSPGRIAYTPGMTVRQAIAEAGGLGMGTLPDDPNGRLSIELAAEREVAAQKVDAVLSQVERLRSELQSVSSEAGQAVADAAASAAEEPPPLQAAEVDVDEDLSAEAAQVLALEEPTEDFDDQLDADASSVLPRPQSRPSEDADLADLESQTDTVSESQVGDVQISSSNEDLLSAASQLLADDNRYGLSLLPLTPDSGLQEVGRQLVEASATMRSVDAVSSRRLLDEMNARLELLRQRQNDEEALVQHDRQEVARVQDLIDRGLVPQAEAAVAERDLLLSSMQSYETADAIARLEIEFARLAAQIDRQPSEAAREILLELERQLVDAELALAQLGAIDQRLALLGGPTVTQTSIDFRFTLHRSGKEGAIAQDVGQDEVILPGDVLEVVALMAAPPP